MFRSKADLILSRYRPIAPKPLPIPPSGSLATDLSSTCASLDSFASSGKARRPRKRRIAPSSGKCPKTPKSEKPQIVSTVSNNNAGISASSLTQGNSDATVPRADLSHVSQSFGMQGHISTPQHIMLDASERPCMPTGDPAMLATPLNHHLAGNLLEQARMFMVSDARKVRHQPSLPLSPHPRGQGYASGGIIEKDLAFMERAAASTVLPDRGVSAGLPCGSVCMKGVSYGGGGFTEMIRGITHLPTAADVQSLMQTRSGSQALEVGVMCAASAENLACGRTSPNCVEAQHRRLEMHSTVPPCWNPGLPVQSPQAEDCTLPLLPNFPSKSPLPTAARPQQASSFTHDSACRREPQADLHTGLAVGSSSEDVRASFVTGSKGIRGQLGSPKQAHHEGSDAEAPSHACPPHVPQLLDGVVPSCAPSALSRDGATVDQVYLQQVYGGSTDPVLLLDDNNQVLWFNKAYDRALKSVSDRLSSKPATTGPYIDPLGHPTPLGSLVLNRGTETSKSVSATLWGFLRKLVMPEVVVSPPPVMRSELNGKDSQSADLDSSRLSLSFGERRPQITGEMTQLSMAHVSSSSIPVWRTVGGACEAQGCGGVGKLTTVTLESITEVFTGDGAVSMECVEMAEARLGAAGSAPAFITDCTSRVRWVNTAFKQMLGHAEQQGINNMVMMGLNNGVMAKHEPPDLTFVCSAEKIPRSAWAFAGLVNLEWMKAGKRRSMTIPCDVSRLVPAATWVWKFDLALSLSLNTCV